MPAKRMNKKKKKKEQLQFVLLLVYDIIHIGNEGKGRVIGQHGAEYTHLHLYTLYDISVQSCLLLSLLLFNGEIYTHTLQRPVSLSLLLLCVVMRPISLSLSLSLSCCYASYLSLSLSCCSMEKAVSHYYLSSMTLLTVHV